jgi:hypothetical protein
VPLVRKVQPERKVFKVLLAQLVLLEQKVIPEQLVQLDLLVQLVPKD